jgi:PPK2 family polyphosphate:nucleotide phosphotransferase
MRYPFVRRSAQGGEFVSSRYLISPGTRVDLASIDPNDTGSWRDKESAKVTLSEVRHRIRALQERLYAEHKQSLLVVLQATDTGGKDGTIKDVFGGLNPQGVHVQSFIQPSEEELDHDFLWRIHQHTPGKGMITVFNRSHYEDVLVVRVKNLAPKSVWSSRYEAINEFEQHLVRNGTTVLKFYLHISKDEQKERLQARLDDPEKIWKFRKGDLADRALWDDYRSAFEDAISKCSTEAAPWYVIPANRKWARNIAVAEIVASTLESMNPQFPEPESGLDKITIPD